MLTGRLVGEAGGLGITAICPSSFLDTMLLGFDMMID